MTQENTLIALRDLAARCVASVAPLVAEYLPIGEDIELLKLGAVDHLMKEKRLPVCHRPPQGIPPGHLMDPTWGGEFQGFPLWQRRAAATPGF